MHELRCENKLHGIIIEDEVIEVKCGSSHCGAKRGVVVMHQFSAKTGDLIKTLRFKEPPRKEHESNGSDNHSAALRSA